MQIASGVSQRRKEIISYSLCKFYYKSHQVPSVPNGFFVVGENQVIPNHKELVIAISAAYILTTV
jgi:hypothetical protein